MLSLPDIMNECGHYPELKIKQTSITFQFYGMSGYTGSSQLDCMCASYVIDVPLTAAEVCLGDLYFGVHA